MKKYIILFLVLALGWGSLHYGSAAIPASLQSSSYTAVAVADKAPEAAPKKDAMDGTAKKVFEFFFSLLPDQKEWPLPVKGLYRTMRLKEISREKIGTNNWVPLKDIPRNMQNALIAIEDRRFYEHGGIDLDSIFRAILINIQADGVVQGGSTLTQQLIKNIALENPEQTVERKLTECVLALFAETQLTKQEILEMYLNTTYFGAGAYGIKAASNEYFRCAPFQLSLTECATIAALPYAPTALNPFNNPEGCRKRRDLVLAQMVKNGYVDKETATRAANEDLVVDGSKKIKEI